MLNKERDGWTILAENIMESTTTGRLEKNNVCLRTLV